jgi:Fe2+ or Zn2+ uptake regulation protein
MISAAETINRLRLSAKAKRLRLTPQRELMLQILGTVPQHLTADQLYRRVRAVMPSVSHATVYRNAQILVRAGVISALERPGGPVRYDVNLDGHHHFICDRCSRVVDVHVADLSWRTPPRSRELAGARITGSRLQLHGLCGRCRSGA